MKVAITGASGFIGRRLVNFHLSRGDNVRVLSRKNNASCLFSTGVTIIPGDLTRLSDKHLPLCENIDVLYHCAAEIRDESRMYQLHVEGTRSLIRLARHRVKRFVQLSSVGVYGPVFSGQVTENSPPHPVNEYERTKFESDQLVSAANRLGDFDLAILRPSIVFGEDMTNQSLAQLISIIQRGRFFFIGKPGASANYVYVDNVVEALYKCATLPQASGEIFNISDWCTMEDLVQTIAQELHIRPAFWRVPRWVAQMASTLKSIYPRFPLSSSRVDAMTSRVTYNCDRIKQVLQHTNNVSISEGLIRLVGTWKASKSENF